MKAILVSKGVRNVTSPDLDNNEADSTGANRAEALIIEALGEEQMVYVEERTTAR